MEAPPPVVLPQALFCVRPADILTARGSQLPQSHRARCSASRLLRVPPRLPEALPAGTTREAELCSRPPCLPLVLYLSGAWLFSSLFIELSHPACGILVARPGFASRPSAVEAWSPNRGASKDFLGFSFYWPAAVPSRRTVLLPLRVGSLRGALCRVLYECLKYHSPVSS